MTQINTPVPDRSNQYLKSHVDLLCSSYERLLGKPFAGEGVPMESRRVKFAVANLQFFPDSGYM